MATGYRSLSSNANGESANKLKSPFSPITKQELHKKFPKPLKVKQYGINILHDPLFNKGLAFESPERDRLGLRGLLPPMVMCISRLCHSVSLHKLRAFHASPLSFRCTDSNTGGSSYSYKVSNRFIARRYHEKHGPSRFARSQRNPLPSPPCRIHRRNGAIGIHTDCRLSMPTM
jgi:hypothetical protein